LDFHANYFLQSLLRIINGVSLIEGILKRLKKFIFKIINIAQVYSNYNLEKLYQSYINFKEAIVFHCIENVW